MSRINYYLHDGKRGAALAIRITPDAVEDKFVEILKDGTIQVELIASSHEAEMNSGLKDFLAEVLNVTKEKIEIISGIKGNEKLVSILEIESEELQRIIFSLIT